MDETNPSVAMLRVQGREVVAGRVYVVFTGGGSAGGLQGDGDEV